MNRNSGFTLVEIPVAMAVIVILLAVGVPNFREFVKKNG